MVSSGKVRNKSDDQVLFQTRKEYAQEVDEWYKSKNRKTGGYFKLGRTTKPLLILGVKNYNIYINQKNILNILNDHPEINKDIIKKIPEILKNPVIIMDSRSRADSLVLIGDIKSLDERPVMISFLFDAKKKVK